jgi:hypothetical protein
MRGTSTGKAFEVYDPNFFPYPESLLVSVLGSHNAQIDDACSLALVRKSAHAIWLIKITPNDAGSVRLP